MCLYAFLCVPDQKKMWHAIFELSGTGSCVSVWAIGKKTHWYTWWCVFGAGGNCSGQDIMWTSCKVGNITSSSPHRGELWGTLLFALLVFLWYRMFASTFNKPNNKSQHITQMALFCFSNAPPTLWGCQVFSFYVNSTAWGGGGNVDWFYLILTDPKSFIVPVL